MSEGAITGTTSENGTGYGYGGQQKVNSGNTVEFLHVPANTVKGEVLRKTYSSTASENPKAIASATSAILSSTVVATKDQGSTAGFQWCVVKGYCQMLVDGTTDVASGAYLEVIATADAGTTDHATVRTANGFAMALEAQTDSDTLTDCYLLGVTTPVAGS